MTKSKTTVVTKTANAPAASQPIVVVNKSSKDGKIKSKDFNLFTQLGSGDKKKGKVSSPESPEELSEADSDDVSEKLVKCIADSINSYSLEKASN